MRHEPAYQPITVETFLSLDFGTDKKFELVDGVIQMMTGACARRRQYLRLSSCRAARLRVPTLWLRRRHPHRRHQPALPGRQRDLRRTAAAGNRHAKTIRATEGHLRSAVTLTEANDVGKKLDEYRRLESIDTIVFVNPVDELMRVVQRLGPTSWRDDLFAQPQDVALSALGITLPHAEIFARD